MGCHVICNQFQYNINEDVAIYISHFKSLSKVDLTKLLLLK